MTDPAGSKAGNNDLFLTVSAVAERLSVSASLVYQMIESGKLAHHRIGTGRGTIRISETDLESYLAECHHELQPPTAKSSCKSRLKHIRL